MSRSRKKSPVVWVVASRTGTHFRRNAHKSMRRATKNAIHQLRFEEAPVRLQEVSDIYDYRDWGWYVTRYCSERWQHALEKVLRKK